MDYLSVQQHKDAMDNAIYRAILHFEKETGMPVMEVIVNYLDEHCTSVTTRIRTWQS